MPEHPLPPAEPAQPAAPGEPAVPVKPTPPGSRRKLLLRRLLFAACGVLVISLAFGAWGMWKVFGPGDGRPTPAQVRVLQEQVDALEQRAATLGRSDQITREANRDLQGALAERDEEIAGLRADVAFYERFVGATAQRRGLALHELKLQPQTDQAWHFTATLTQNVNRGAIITGRLQIAVEGTRGGRLQRLEWAQLRQQANEPGVPFSFKYFQQVEGDLVLPPDFQPVRVIARLVPQAGPATEQSFTWAAATASTGTGGA